MAVAAKELPACPVETTLTLISDKWKVLILRDLMPGTKRFGELKKSIGSVSQKVLTAQLREMEQSGLLTRTVYPEVPPRVEYTLTDLGYSLKPILDALQNWGEAYKAQNGASAGEQRTGGRRSLWKAPRQKKAARHRRAAHLLRAPSEFI